MPSEEKKEYEKIKNFLLWSLGIVGTLITIMSVVAIFVSFQDREAMRKDFSETIKELKERSEDLNTKSEKTITEIQEKTQSEILEIKDIAKKDFDAVKISARELALNEANKRVNEVFRQENVDQLIRIESNKILEGKTKEILTTEIENSFIQFEKINSWEMKVRSGDYDAIRNFEFWLSTEFKNDYKNQHKARQSFYNIQNEFRKQYFYSVRKKPKEDILYSIGLKNDDNVNLVKEKVKEKIKQEENLHERCYWVEFYNLISGESISCFSNY